MPLSLFSDLATAWAEQIEPWCRAATGHLCAAGAESWLVCGTRGQADWARDQLLAAGGGLIGLRFLSPFAFRAKLAEALGIPFELTGREVLNFAVRARATVYDQLAIQTDPAAWLEALQEADTAGLLDVPEFRQRLVPKVLAEFIDRLRADKAWLPGVDRRIAAAAEAHPRGRVRLGLLGIDDRQSTVLPLLRAAARWGESVEAWLPQPRTVGETAAMAWIETLEEIFRVEKETLPHEPAGPQARLVECIESATRDENLTPPALLTGLRASDEIELAAEFAAEWLNSGAPGRCAFVFPQAGGGSVLLSRRLQEQRLRHEDRLGERPEPSANVRLLRGLAAYHREGQSAPALLRLLGVQRGQEDPARHLELEQSLQRRFRRVQIARAVVCTRRTPAAELVQKLGRWPDRGPVSAFRECWNGGAAAIGAGLRELEAFWNGIARWIPESREVDGRAVLGALEDALLAVPSQFARNPRHLPHSRLVLTSLREACGQTWSAVVLMHSVESVWPVASPPARFLTESLRRAWNGRGGPRLREAPDAIAGDEAAWLELLSNCRGPIVFAGRQRSAEAERGEQPNAWLVRALAACGEKHPVLRWEGSGQVRQPPAAPLPQAAELRRVHESRADQHQPFDRYSFDFREVSPLEHPPFSPSRLDAILRAPGQAALLHLFGAEARRDLDASFARSFPQALGTVVHEWIARALAEAGQNGVVLQAKALDELLRDAVTRWDSWLRTVLLHDLGLSGDAPLSRWWQMLRAEAEGFVRLFLEGLRASDYVDAGWTFTTEQEIASQGPPAFKGRMDLALRRGLDAVVIDFKTGRRLHQPNAFLSRGLELVAYGWCLAEQTQGALALALAGKDTSVPAPKFTREHLAEFEVWRQRLADLQTRGCYGWLGPLQHARGEVEELPLTTVFVPEWVLERKADHSRIPRPRKGEG